MRSFLCFTFMVFMLLPIFANNEQEIVTLENGKKIIINANYTWYYQEENLNNEDVILQNKKTLRQKVNATDQQILIACQMREQGWIYIMPVPKSDDAEWFNFDKNTVWYNGWWSNYHTQKYSRTTPILNLNGRYEGDNIDMSNTFSKGGSPGKPDIFMFLLSDCGGPVENCINLFHQ